jgi:hypothetical protein
LYKFEAFVSQRELVSRGGEFRGFPEWENALRDSTPLKLDGFISHHFPSYSPAKPEIIERFQSSLWSNFFH